jgi:hypothetical protein
VTEAHNESLAVYGTITWIRQQHHLVFCVPTSFKTISSLYHAVGSSNTHSNVQQTSRLKKLGQQQYLSTYNSSGMSVLTDLPSGALLCLLNHVVAVSNAGQVLKLATVSYDGKFTIARRRSSSSSSTLSPLRSSLLTHSHVLMIVLWDAPHAAQACQHYWKLIAHADWFWQQQSAALGWIRYGVDQAIQLHAFPAGSVQGMVCHRLSPPY